MSDDSASFPETPPPRTTGGNWRWEPPSAAELQKLMPGYTIEKLLGRGGMGAVYRGVQTNLDRPVAIKILPPDVEKEDPSFAERFKSEAKLMARLNHPAVVAVYDFGSTSAGQLYFAMEYVDGSDVSQMLATQGRLPPEHALAITAHVCDALGAAHELGIVHRDIKPANVLINQKGQVKVADFGLAKVEEPGQHGLTKTGYAMGTPDFVAPEALTLGTSIDGRADLYAVGVMLYQMLTGNIPRGAFKPASVLVPSVDPRYDQIIVKAMQHDREERHQSAAQLRAELDVILTVPLVRQSAPEPAAVPTMLVAQTPAQRSAAQKPAAKAPAPRKRGTPLPQNPDLAQSSVGAPRSQPKSKAPLLIGLAAAAAIGVGAFVMLSGKKPPASTRSVTRLSPSTEPWQDMLRDTTRIRHSGAVVTTPEGLRFPDAGEVRFLNPHPTHDGAVRILATHTGTSIQLHARLSSSSLYLLALEKGNKITLARWDAPAKKTTFLREIVLPQTFTLGQDYELELRAVGPVLTAKFNGAVVGTVTDDTYPDGEFNVHVLEKNAAPALIKALQVLDLGGSKPAASTTNAVADSSKTAPSDARLSPSTEHWQDMLAPSSKVTPLGTAAITPAGLRFSNTGEVRFEKPNPQHDGAVRMLATYNGGYIQLQAHFTGGSTYQLVLGDGGNKLRMARWDSSEAKSVSLREIPLPQPVKSGQDFELELRVVGPVLTAKFNGAVVDTVTDGTYPEGGFSVRAGEKNTTPTLVKALQVLDLGESKPAASASVPVAVSSASRLQPGVWVPVRFDTAAKDWGMMIGSGGTMDTEKGRLILPRGVWFERITGQRIAARARVKPVKALPDTPWCMVGFNRGAGETHPRLMSHPGINSEVKIVGRNDEILARQKLSRTPPIGEPMVIEWALMDGAFITSIDSGPLLVAAITEGLPAFPTLNAPGTDFESLEVMLLDGASADKYPDFVRLGLAQNKASPSPGTLAAPSQDPKPAKVPDPAKWIPAASPGFKTGGDAVVRDGVVEINSNGAYYSTFDSQDAAIRARLQTKSQVGFTGLSLRSSNSGSYGLVWQGDGRVVIKRTDAMGIDRKQVNLKTFETRFVASDAMREVIFSAVGNVVAVWIDGQFIGSVADEHLKSGSLGFATSRTTYHDVAFQSFDAPDVAASPASSSPATKASEPFPPGRWVKVFTKAEDLPADLRKPGSGVKFENGWIIAEKDVGLSIETNRQWSNAALRCRARVSNQRLTVPSIRGVGKPFQNYQLNYLSSGAWRLSYFNSTAASAGVSGLETLSQFPGLVPFADGSEHLLELAAVSQRLIARGDAKLLPVIEHAKLPKGIISLFLKSPVCDIEVMNLDGLPEAEAMRLLGVDEKGNDLRGAASSSPSAPAAALPAGQWVKLFTKTEDLHKSVLDAGVTIEDGWIRGSHAKTSVSIPLPAFKNGAVRARFQVGGEAGNPSTSSRIFLHETAGEKMYLLGVTGGMLSCQERAGDQYTKIFRPPCTVEGDYLMEFGIVGSLLIGRIDNQMFSGHNAAFPNGSNRVFAIHEDIRDIEVINLDGLPESDALRLLGVDEQGNDLRASAVAQERQRAEQEKMVDAMAAIPELKVLHEQFVKLQAERVTAPFEAEVSKLNNDYRSGIDRDIANEKKAGHLDGVLALEAEKQILADRRPVPLTDTEQTTALLRKLRVIYREAYARIEAARATNLKALTDPLTLRLKQMESALTQQDRVADAKAVREYREKLSDVGPAPPAAEDAGAKMKEASDKSGAAQPPPPRGTPKKIPRGDDRKAAEWVISLGGKVLVSERGNVQTISAVADLPPGKFDLTDVQLEFLPGTWNPPKAMVKDLLPLAGLPHLRSMQFRYFPLEDEHLSILGSLPELTGLLVDFANLTDAVFEHLLAAPSMVTITLRNESRLKGASIAQLKSLKMLKHLSLHGCKLSDKGFAALAQLPDLQELQLPSSGMTDAHLASLRGFKKLTLLNLRFNTISATAVAAMRNLNSVTRLGMDFKPGQMVEEAALLAKGMPKVTAWSFEKAEGGAYSAADIRGMSEFTQLSSIEGFDSRFDDAAAVGVLDLQGLKELTLDHSSVTDVALAMLAGHKSLSLLKLRSLPTITDKGLTSLAALKSLITLEVALCPGVTSAGITAFKKQRPDVVVTKK
jgi:serine/threonine protein kinase